jgi:peptidoglycan/xylan/chitin deacetylase (PgdA/CDA1 family)
VTTTTRYVVAYDLEDPNLCPKAAPRLVELHRRYEIPATFFVLGTVLERRGAELRVLFDDDPLFDLASHTYSHRPLKGRRVHGPGVDLDELEYEI